MVAFNQTNLLSIPPSPRINAHSQENLNHLQAVCKKIDELKKAKLTEFYAKENDKRVFDQENLILSLCEATLKGKINVLRNLLSWLLPKTLSPSEYAKLRFGLYYALRSEHPLWKRKAMVTLIMESYLRKTLKEVNCLGYALWQSALDGNLEAIRMISVSPFAKNIPALGNDSLVMAIFLSVISEQPDVKQKIILNAIIESPFAATIQAHNCMGYAIFELISRGLVEGIKILLENPFAEEIPTIGEKSLSLALYDVANCNQPLEKRIEMLKAFFESPLGPKIQDHNCLGYALQHLILDGKTESIKFILSSPYADNISEFIEYSLEDAIYYSVSCDQPLEKRKEMFYAILESPLSERIEIDNSTGFALCETIVHDKMEGVKIILYSPFVEKIPILDVDGLQDALYYTVSCDLPPAKRYEILNIILESPIASKMQGENCLGAILIELIIKKQIEATLILLNSPYSKSIQVTGEDSLIEALSFAKDYELNEVVKIIEARCAIAS